MQHSGLIDFGNSYIKCKLGDEIKLFSYEQQEEFLITIAQQDYQEIYYFQTYFGELDWWISWAHQHQIRLHQVQTQDVIPYLNYDHQLVIDQLGIDLALMTYYVQQKMSFNNVLVIGYGTWTTCLTIQNQQLKAVGILPGLNAMHQAMFNPCSNQPYFSVHGNQNDNVFGYGNYLFLQGLWAYCQTHHYQLIVAGSYCYSYQNLFDTFDLLVISQLGLLGLDLFVKMSKKSNRLS